MYERSAIVLERYFDNLFGLNKKDNLKVNYQNYKNTVDEIQKYQTIVGQEEDVIQKFDAVAKEIQMIQKKQEKIYESNKKLEEERNKLFNNLDDESNTLGKSFKKIEDNLDKNNQDLKELRENFMDFLAQFSERQKERNKIAKERRVVEAKYMSYMDNIKNELKQISVPDVKEVRAFFLSEDTKMIEDEVLKLMLDNGKSEKIGFDENVLKNAISERVNIAKKEAECYIMAYERMRKLVDEAENDNIKIEKYKKNVRDLSVKMNFLIAEKDYILAFLDNERMTVINGENMHKKLMEEACKNFLSDINQIHQLYELILKEISGKATKKSYKELYNYDYLQTIQNSEKNFEQEVNQLNLNAGAIINSNYWRINGINNVYTVFQSELKEKFGKDVTPKEEKIEVAVGVTDENEAEVIPKKRGRKKKNVELLQDNTETLDIKEEIDVKKASKTDKSSKNSEKDKEEFNLYKLQEFSEGEQTKDHHKNLLDEDSDKSDDLDEYDALFDDLDDDELYEEDLNDDELIYEDDLSEENDIDKDDIKNKKEKVTTSKKKTKSLNEKNKKKVQDNAEDDDFDENDDIDYDEDELEYDDDELEYDNDFDEESYEDDEDNKDDGEYDDFDEYEDDEYDDNEYDDDEYDDEYDDDEYDDEDYEEENENDEYDDEDYYDKDYEEKDDDDNGDDYIDDEEENIYAMHYDEDDKVNKKNKKLKNKKNQSDEIDIEERINQKLNSKTKSVPKEDEKSEGFFKKMFKTKKK